MVLQKMVMTPRISHEIHRERIGICISLSCWLLLLDLTRPTVVHYTPVPPIDQSLFPLASREAKFKM